MTTGAMTRPAMRHRSGINRGDIFHFNIFRGHLSFFNGLAIVETLQMT